MANLLSMAKINAIQTLHQSGHSNRTIAKLLGVDRETVRKYVAAQNPPNAPTVSEEVGHVPSGPPSDCEPWRELIKAKLEQGLSAKRIHQDLVGEQGCAASYWSVRRFVGRLQQKTPLPVRRIETAAGEEAQVDFGSGAPVVDAAGKRRKPWMFRIVLSHSRKGYSEVVWHQTTDNFIAALENAFHHFGGVPKRLVIDNLKAAVGGDGRYEIGTHYHLPPPPKRALVLSSALSAMATMMRELHVVGVPEQFLIALVVVDVIDVPRLIGQNHLTTKFADAFVALVDV